MADIKTRVFKTGYQLAELFLGLHKTKALEILKPQRYCPLPHELELYGKN